jgi:SAM-dependent methyltransferase
MTGSETQDPRAAIAANREAWNAATPHHQRVRGQALRDGFRDPAFTTFDRGPCDVPLRAVLETLPLQGTRIAQLQCNNGRELLSLMLYGAAEGVGFDLSDAAVAEAKELAAISGRRCSFVQSAIEDIGSGYDGRFDFIYVSEGALVWIPDLRRYFGVAARLLAPGGRLLVYDQHPVTFMFDAGDPASPLAPRRSYFDRGPVTYRGGLDYYGNVAYDGPTACEFHHTMGELLTALAGSGLALRRLEELPHDMVSGYRAFEQAGQLPLSYLLLAQGG